MKNDATSFRMVVLLARYFRTIINQHIHEIVVRVRLESTTDQAKTSHNPTGFSHPEPNRASASRACVLGMLHIAAPAPRTRRVLSRPKRAGRCNGMW